MFPHKNVSDFSTLILGSHFTKNLMYTEHQSSLGFRISKGCC